jgi:hypothetical protein
MGIDPTRHFDAPRPASSFAAAVDLLRANWGVAVALAGVTAVVLTIATAWFLFDACFSAAVDASVAATPISVLLKVQTSTAEAQALGARIVALPNVATAALRSKEDALKTLVAAGLPTPDGRNPLPDVWTVTVKPPLLNASRQSLTTFMAETRYLLGGLPAVESTAVDERWIAALDRWSLGRKQWGPKLAGAILLLLAVMSFSSAFLAGGALSDAASLQKSASWLALAFISVSVLLAAIVIVAAIAWTVQSLWNAAPGMPVEVTVAQLLSAQRASLFVTSIALLLVLALGLIVGRRVPP